MQEFVSNFQARHGAKDPTPDLYIDKDESQDEGLELNDGSKMGRKAVTGGKPEAGMVPSKSTGGGVKPTGSSGGYGGTPGGLGGSGGGAGRSRGGGGDPPW